MSRTPTIDALAISAIALALAPLAEAGTTRTFVSTTGNDANVSVNCSASANCRTFAAALSVTNTGGEVVVLSSGGYGPATISQPVVITADSVVASISVTTSGANGLTIDTTGNVTLTGLGLHGEATGNDGVLVSQVGILRLYNLWIENFTNDGIEFSSSGDVAVYNSAINDNATDGVEVDSGNAYVHGTTFDHNFQGVLAHGTGKVTVADSSAQYNSIAFAAIQGVLILNNDRAILNNTGLFTFGGGTLYFSNCLVAENEVAYNIGTSTIMAGTSPGTSLIGPNQSTSGALSAPNTFQ
jgi:hypothetical protein